MQTTAENVDASLDEVRPERKAAFSKLRDLCRNSLKSFEESMEYGGPCYSRNGDVEAGFASQKEFHWTLHPQIGRAKCIPRSAQGKRRKFRQGVFHYSTPAKIDLKVVEMMLKATHDSTGIIFGHKVDWTVI